jgi:hypothetical protein
MPFRVPIEARGRGAYGGQNLGRRSAIFPGPTFFSGILTDPSSVGEPGVGRGRRPSKWDILIPGGSGPVGSFSLRGGRCLSSRHDALASPMTTTMPFPRSGGSSPRPLIRGCLPRREGPSIERPVNRRRIEPLPTGTSVRPRSQEYEGLGKRGRGTAFPAGRNGFLEVESFDVGRPGDPVVILTG